MDFVGGALLILIMGALIWFGPLRLRRWHESMGRTPSDMKRAGDDEGYRPEMPTSWLRIPPG